jgi:hypothetical protein
LAGGQLEVPELETAHRFVAFLFRRHLCTVSSATSKQPAMTFADLPAASGPKDSARIFL